MSGAAPSAGQALEGSAAEETRAKTSDDELEWMKRATPAFEYGFRLLYTKPDRTERVDECLDLRTLQLNFDLESAHHAKQPFHVRVRVTNPRSFQQDWSHYKRHSRSGVLELPLAPSVPASVTMPRSVFIQMVCDDDGSGVLVRIHPEYECHFVCRTSAGYTIKIYTRDAECNVMKRAFDKDGQFWLAERRQALSSALLPMPGSAAIPASVIAGPSAVSSHDSGIVGVVRGGRYPLTLAEQEALAKQQRLHHAQQQQGQGHWTDQQAQGHQYRPSRPTHRPRPQQQHAPVPMLTQGAAETLQPQSATAGASGTGQWRRPPTILKKPDGAVRDDAASNAAMQQPQNGYATQAGAAPQHRQPHEYAHATQPLQYAGQVASHAYWAQQQQLQQQHQLQQQQQQAASAMDGQQQQHYVANLPAAALPPLQWPICRNCGAVNAVYYAPLPESTSIQQQQQSQQYYNPYQQQALAQQHHAQSSWPYGSDGLYYGHVNAQQQQQQYYYQQQQQHQEIAATAVPVAVATVADSASTSPPPSAVLVPVPTATPAVDAGATGPTGGWQLEPPVEDDDEEPHQQQQTDATSCGSPGD